MKKKKKKNTQDSHLKENVAKNTKKMRSMATPKPQPQQGFDTNSDQMNTKKPVIVIAGDSLLKNVQGWWVSKGMKVKTVVKAFLEPPLKTCLITSNLQSSITLKKLYFT